ncbi:MAG TPA: putative glycoside hydrolase [Gaiellaceae bacterium]|nr:putative glycoside hydrolase [Gaiellaceae bacterium]
MGVAVALAIGLTCLLGSSTPVSAASSTPALAGDGVCELGGHLGNVSQLNGYSLVIGDAADAGRLAALPGTTLAYFAAPDVNTKWNAGVSYHDALANGWLLKDGSGNLLKNLGFPDNDIGDVGSDGYQHAFLANALAYLHAHPGIAGIYIDDVLSDLKPMTGVEAAEYPTQQAWADAQLSFVRTVGSALRAKGYYVLVNASAFIPGDSDSDTGATTVSWWKELGPYVSGLMDESYAQASDGSDRLRTTGSAWYQNWDGWQRLVQVAQSMGKDFVGVTYGGAGDTQAMTYGKSSFLLDWDGTGGAFIYTPKDGSDPTNAASTVQVGKPAGPKTQVGVGWMRTYTGGVVLVDPSPSTSQTFRLGGTYLTSSGALVTSVTLSPTSGMILRAAGL